MDSKKPKPKDIQYNAQKTKGQMIYKYYTKRSKPTKTGDELK